MTLCWSVIDITTEKWLKGDYQDAFLMIWKYSLGYSPLPLMPASGLMQIDTTVYQKNEVIRKSSFVKRHKAAELSPSFHKDDSGLQTWEFPKLLD